MGKKAANKTVEMRTMSASPQGVFAPGARRVLPAHVAAHLIASGQADPVDERGEPAPELASQPEPEFPRHTGAGWYELSNGEKIRGEDEAFAAEAALAQG